MRRLEFAIAPSMGFLEVFGLFDIGRDVSRPNRRPHVRRLHSKSAEMIGEIVHPIIGIVHGLRVAKRQPSQIGAVL